MHADGPQDARETKVLIHSDRPEAFRSSLAERFPQVLIHSCTTYDGLEPALAEIEPAIVLSHKFESRPYPGRVLVAAPSVRWIHIGGTGVDHLRPWDDVRLTVTNSGGAAAQAMAEYALGGVFALNLGLPRFLRRQAMRQWMPDTIRKSAGGTLVVVGLGRIGRAVAALAEASGLEVIGVRARGGPVPGISLVVDASRLAEVLGRADHVVLALPLTPDTRGLFDQAMFAAIKPGALLVNISRGGIVDERAMLSALESGRLRGAVVDVFEREPLPPDSPLWGMTNVIVTSHVAGFVEGWEKEVGELFASNLSRWLNGEQLLNRVDCERGY